MAKLHPMWDSFKRARIAIKPAPTDSYLPLPARERDGDSIALLKPVKHTHNSTPSFAYLCESLCVPWR